MLATLKGKTQHGRNRVNEHGNEWNVLKVVKDMPFNANIGFIWLKLKSTKTGDVRTVHINNDVNFDVVVLNTLTENEIQLGLDNLGFLVGDALEDYEVETEKQFIDKMLVEDILYQVLFWWDAILDEDQQMEFGEKYFPGNDISDDEKIFIFLSEKLAQKLNRL